MATEPTRRAVLGTALAGVAGTLGLAGCKGIAALGPVPKIGPDVRTLERAIESEEALVALYREAAGAVDGGTTRAGATIAAIQGDHQAHLDQLRSRLILPPRLAHTRLRPSPPRPPQLPAGKRALLRALAETELAAAARLTSQLGPVPPALAELMASIAASEAAHVVYLHGAPGRGASQVATGALGHHAPKAQVAALQSALAAEQAAAYGYGVAGAQLSGKAFDVASADCVLHERDRDALSELISALGAVPQPAAVAYRLPIPVHTAADAARLAADLEHGIAAGYLPLAGAPDPALRTLAATRMQQAAGRAARWGARPEPFPGLATHGKPTR